MIIVYENIPDDHRECRVAEFIWQANECDFFIKIPEASYRTIGRTEKKRFYYFNYQFRCGLTNSAGTFCSVNINFIKITLLCDHFRCCYFCLFFLLHYGEKRVFCLPHSCALPSPKANRNQIESLGNRKMFFFVGRLFFFIKTPNGARQTCQTFIDTPHSSICALCGPFDKHLLGNPITEFTFTVVTVSI